MDKSIYDYTSMMTIKETVMPQEVSERYEQDHGTIPFLGTIMIFSRLGKK